MQIDVGKHISDLLFEHQTITIPGFGGFTSEYKSAVVDQIQGKMAPPSKKIIFNKNLAANDGLLNEHIKQQHNITAYEAQKAVEDYVRQLRAALERQEIIVIPNVGRIYKDYEKQLQFLPENTNFNKNSFGLPNIEFRPIARPKEVFREASPAAAIKDPTAPTTEEIVNEKLADWFQKNIILIVSVSAIVIALGVFMMLYPKQPIVEALPTVPAERYNAKPSKEETVVSNSQSPNSEEEFIIPENEKDDISEVEAPTSFPEQKSCIIVIGMFGNEDNIKKLLEKIFKAGYEPYQEKNGRLTRIGIQFAYEDESEIEVALKNVRSKFHEDSFVYKKL